MQLFGCIQKPQRARAEWTGLALCYSPQGLIIYSFPSQKKGFIPPEKLFSFPEHLHNSLLRYCEKLFFFNFFFHYS